MATTKSEVTGKTHASAVSKQLRRLGYNPYGAHETRFGGYICKEWDVKDTRDGKIVRVYYDGIHRELKPGDGDKRKTAVREKARLERMSDMADDLKTIGYSVVWGWDVSGKTDNTFLAVSGAPARRTDIQADEETDKAPEAPEEAPEPVVEPTPAPEPVRLHHALLPMLTIEQAEEHVRLIQVTAQTNPEAASNMERHLYYLALVAVVGGSDEAVDVAAIVLQTQGILLPR